MASGLDQIEPVPGQIGVVCVIEDRVAGLDLFDKPATFEKYLRGIVAGHVLDAPFSKPSSDSIRFIEDFSGSDQLCGPGHRVRPRTRRGNPPERGGNRHRPHLR